MRVSSFQIRFDWASDHLEAIRHHLPEGQFGAATDLHGITPTGAQK
ncbi:MAG: hypothetical protein ACE5JS_15790 [Nitrospinota bacterium]